MKLEIVEESKYNDGLWYSVRVNDMPVKFSRKLEEMEKVYQEIKDNPSILEDKVSVLKTEEI